ncbi:MAG: hypothetical protein K9J85_03755 [Desulfobacteraceae bacterium]|nr:hypothetical protein [Desulfobacteraceae bacterium]
MKFVHITFHFEYAEEIEKILDRHRVENFVRYPMLEGKDRDGKHYGSQVYPGSTTVVQAQVPEDSLDDVMEDLKAFREEKTAHRHLEAVVIPIEKRLE